MREYAIFSPRFWQGRTFAHLRREGWDAVTAGIYLFTGPLADMTGVYHLPPAMLADALDTDTEGALMVLERVRRCGFCEYDPELRWVWVRSMLDWQVQGELKGRDKRIVAVQNRWASFPDLYFLGDFWRRYGDRFSLPERPGMDSGSMPLRLTGEAHTGGMEGAPMPHRSQDQEQEQEQDKHPVPSKGDGTAGKGKNRFEYPPEFEDTWAEYPKRAGNNPKRKAFKAWHGALARLVVKPNAKKLLHDATRRYAAFCKATGKVGTETVMMAATFFGPDDPWNQDWAIPAPKANGQEPRTNEGWVEAGKELGLEPKVGESWPQFISRVRSARERQ